MFCQIGYYLESAAYYYCLGPRSSTLRSDSFTPLNGVNVAGVLPFMSQRAYTGLDHLSFCVTV